MTPISWEIGKILSWTFIAFIVRQIMVFLLSTPYLCSYCYCCLVVKSCPTLCDPMDCSMPGLPVLHHLSELAQTHVHWVGDVIQPSYPLSAPSPSAFNLSQHQGLFKWVSSLHQVAKVLEFQLQHQSLQWTPRTDLLQNGLVGSPCSPRDSRVFSKTTVQKHQFFGAQLSLWPNSHIYK